MLPGNRRNNRKLFSRDGGPFGGAVGVIEQIRQRGTLIVVSLASPKWDAYVGTNHQRKLLGKEG